MAISVSGSIPKPEYAHRRIRQLHGARLPRAGSVTGLGGYPLPADGSLHPGSGTKKTTAVLTVDGGT